MEKIETQAGIVSRNETVAVVGSGIAGCLVAHELANEGFDVTVIEEREQVFSGTSAGAIQAHLGGLYSGNIETAKECLNSAIIVKKSMPFSLNERKAMFLVADQSEAPLDEYISFYSQLTDYYADLSSHDRVFGRPENFFRILNPEEYGFAKNIEGGIATQEPGLDILRTRATLLRRLGVLGVNFALNTEVTNVEIGKRAFRLSLQSKGVTENVSYDQVVNAGGYKARLLDHKLGDTTQYNLYLKTWNILRNKPSQQPLPPFYVVRGDFMHHSPIGDEGLVSLITATNEGSYLGVMSYGLDDPNLPADWVEILQSGQVPAKQQRQQTIIEYAKDNFLHNAEFETVDLIPGVAVSHSSSRQDRTRRGANQIVPGWQTIVPTKATNALELAREACGHAIEYSTHGGE